MAREDKDMVAMYAAIRHVVEASMLWREFRGLDLDEQEKRRRRDQRWQNRIQHLRVLLGIFEWRYILLPIGVRRVVHVYSYNREHVYVYAWHVHIFGLRVFRWTNKQKVYREQATLPRVPFRKYRSSPKRRRKSV
jgi:hypothetical protein